MNNHNIRLMHLYCNSISEEFRKPGPCNKAEKRKRLRKMSPEACKPKVPKNGYALLNAEEMHRLHPDSFELHAKEARNNVKVGQYVKMCLVGPTLTEPIERFWVWVVSKEATIKGSTFIGQLHIDLCCTAKHGISEGDMLEFATEHILVIEQ